MMKLMSLKISLILLVLFIATAQPTYAQSSPVSASVDRTDITANEQVTLTITVEADEERPIISLPDLAHFDTIRTTQVSQMSIINGVVGRRYFYHYTLRPLTTGELAIGPIDVEVSGQTFTTDPILIQVNQADPLSSQPGQQDGDANQPPSAEVFVEAEIDNANPHLGEQVVYTHRLYTVYSPTGIDYDFPRFTGFWQEEEAVVRDSRLTLNGRRYTVRETKVILFPTQTGPLTIDETILTSRSSLFSNGFILKTAPIDLEVKPLPDDPPRDFGGAVGLFTIEAEVSNNLARVNEPITLLVRLFGQGNISSAPDPTWPEIQEWRVFDAQSTTNTNFLSGNLSGERIYERLMVPGAPGRFTVPSINYTYFDPNEGEYRTISTNPIEVTVEPGTGEAPPPVVIGANKEEIERIGADIRHIKPAPQVLNRATAPVTEQNRYWLAWGIPILLVVGYAVWSRREAYFRRNVGRARSMQAHRQAKKSLAQARKNSGDLYIASGHILNAYLSDKLNKPVVGLTQDALAGALAGKGVAPEQIKQVQTILAESDMGRFGPGGHLPNHAGKLLDKAEQLIVDLEKTFPS
jgi:hypothetical protein